MMDFVIIPIKTKPAFEPTIMISDILSEEDEDWVREELKNLKLKLGTYYAFEEKGHTLLYRRAG